MGNLLISPWQLVVDKNRLDGAVKSWEKELMGVLREFCYLFLREERSVGIGCLSFFC